MDTTERWAAVPQPCRSQAEMIMMARIALLGVALCFLASCRGNAVTSSTINGPTNYRVVRTFLYGPKGCRSKLLVENVMTKERVVAEIGRAIDQSNTVWFIKSIENSNNMVVVTNKQSASWTLPIH